MHNFIEQVTFARCAMTSLTGVGSHGTKMSYILLNVINKPTQRCVDLTKTLVLRAIIYLKVTIIYGYTF